MLTVTVARFVFNRRVAILIQYACFMLLFPLTPVVWAEGPVLLDVAPLSGNRQKPPVTEPVSLFLSQEKLPPQKELPPAKKPVSVFLSQENAPPLQARESFFKHIDGLAGKSVEQEALLRDWLKERPGDAEAHFYLARVLSWQGKYAESLLEYRDLREAEPDNADYLLGNAQVLLWDKQPKDALVLLERAEKISPQYEEVYQVKIQTLFELGKYREVKSTIAEAKQRFPKSTWKMPEVEPKPVTLGDHPVEVETGFSFDGLTKNFSGWNGQYISIKKPFSQRAGIYASGQRTDRFDLQDFNMTAGAYFPITKKWGGVVEGSLSPTGDVLPQWSIYGEVNRILPWGFVAHAGFRHTEYQNAITELGLYSLEYYWKHLSASYTLYNNYLHNGGWSNSHVGQIEFFYGKHENSIGLTGALGKELENVIPRGVISTDVMALYLTGIQWLHPRWGITYALGVQKQGDIYTRRGLQFGLRYLF